MSPRRDRIRDKVMSRVEIVQGTVLDTPCHIWTGPTSGSAGRGKDYPRMCLDGGTMAVHIVMYVLEHGPIPPRKQLDHRCRTRRCVNADHLEMVTHKENQRRRDEARRFAYEEIAA
ncbi:MULTISPECIES: HNH endonuclease signature motif containing protein [unclassified Bradyrhizobium]|uniref:HNH endonuclease signature motif containing protein n=1 Tax=unclassified Bradyrhizobium TaxID=2631580 RepID=UPI0028EC3C60|nr:MULTISPECIES: HNH endonuclease signature motif containing protein [unclassified Bradyrhizobium]